MSIITLRSDISQYDFKRGKYWNHESPFLPVDWEQINSETGAPSLKHSAMRYALQDQSQLKAFMFKNIPWLLAKYLWDCLDRCNKQTLHMWTIMATVYPDYFFTSCRRYRLMTGIPVPPVKNYIEMMSSDSCNWRAILSLSSTWATVADLVSIGNMKNLVALEIHKSPAANNSEGHWDMEDRIVRSWVDMAKDLSSLQHLRVLKFRHQNELTSNIFRMLKQLPQLQMIVMEDCGRFNRDDIDGWYPRRLDTIIDKVAGTDIQHNLRLSYIYDGIPRHLKSYPFNDMMELEPSALNNPDDHKALTMEFQLPVVDREPSGLLLRPSSSGFENAVTCFVRMSSNKLEGPNGPKSKWPKTKVQKRVLKSRGRDMADLLREFC
ncbi:hypothetical protein N7495_001612 [Penicillium taxi]|uniref:uncharacterized protein n=1 Tax=Penicillium taxi TaxID=168475 RepID=UPI0025451977|nr:uncharacterized protein N7495_001612 [Penicillium taxi]KAJ5908930.1 hypothetical protein N7495_001612 [Penicillium taxi]